MRRAHFAFAGLSLAILFAVSLRAAAQQASPLERPQFLTPDDRVAFSDDFEVEHHWTINEELVNRCYVDGVGQVSRSTDYALTGRHSLRIWANHTRSIFDNHVIGGYKVADAGRNGRWRYQVYSFIAPETAATGQTGPELSMQNTRRVSPGQTRTSIAGIQYHPNPYLPPNWAVWVETASGRAGWYEFMRQRLAPGRWYQLTLEADFTTNRYVSFSIHGGGLDLAVDLSALHIAAEPRNFAEAFVLTLEGENLWQDCTKPVGNFEYKIYYDHLQLLPGRPYYSGSTTDR